MVGNSSAASAHRMKMSAPVHRSGRPYQNGVQWVGLLRLPAGISWLETPLALGCSAWKSSLEVQHLMWGSGLGLLHSSTLPGTPATPTPLGLTTSRARTSLPPDKVPNSLTLVILGPKSPGGITGDVP